MTEGEPTKLGEVLRTAREARFIDLARVERDTKIRVRYLAALEAGDYRELPGTVYSRGFLRNYGLYLGLDPDYLVDLYRLETGSAAERRAIPIPPQPIAERQRRPFVVTSGAVAAVILTLLVAAFAVYLVGEFITFARTPELRITDPPTDLVAFDGSQYVIRGVTEPNSTVTTDGLRENPRTTADASGAFSVLVRLVPGANVITLVATDPLTGRDSAAVRRTITVGGGASPTPTSAIALTRPEEAAALEDGMLAVAGTAPAGATLTLTAAPVAAPVVTFVVRNLAGQTVAVLTELPTAPAPVVVTADADGVFSTELPLGLGSWDLTVEEVGATPPISVARRVVVGPADGLHGSLTVSGSASYLEIDEDGVPKAGISGRNADPGAAIELSATSLLRIRVGNAGAVRLTINGIALPSMGGPRAVVEWTVARLP